MILTIDQHSGVPVYKQIIDQVRFHASTGLIDPGDEIPSTRALSRELGVNPMTVSKAFALLEEEGVLERRPGLPHVVARRDGDEEHTSKIEQLKETLRPVAVKTRQLGVQPDEATAVFRRLLDEDEGER